MTATTDTLSAFIGIANENEFFSHHYLAEVFRGDVEETLARWRGVEEAHPGDDSPPRPLQPAARPGPGLVRDPRAHRPRAFRGHPTA